MRSETQALCKGTEAKQLHPTPQCCACREIPRHPRSTAALAASPRRHPQCRSPAREAASSPGPDCKRAPCCQSRTKKVQPSSPHRGLAPHCCCSSYRRMRDGGVHASLIAWLADSPIPPVPSQYGDASAQGQSLKDEEREPWKAGTTWSTGG